MSSTKELILYRGIHTSPERAEIILERGIENKWRKEHFSFHRYSKEEIERFFETGQFEVMSREGNNNCVAPEFACATERDACFYILKWGDKGGYISGHTQEYPLPNDQISLPYVIQFKVDINSVSIDGNDGLYYMLGFLEQKNLPDDRYDDLCKLFSKKMIDRYRPMFQNPDIDNVKLTAMFFSEEEAILSLYNNKDNLIDGRRNIQFLSSFVFNSPVTKDDIIGVREMTDIDCQIKVDSFKPASTISIRDFRYN